MKRLPTKPFIDIVERPEITLGGRFIEQSEVPPVKTYTAEQAKKLKLKLAPPPDELKRDNHLESIRRIGE